MKAKRDGLEQRSVRATQGDIRRGYARLGERRISTHFAVCPTRAAAETMASSMRARSAG
jgi:hypothetical protein